MPFFRKKPRPFFTTEENEQLVSAIKQAETLTSGEIRVYAESRCRAKDPLHRAAELFHGLHMQQTQHRNGVLIYLAVRDRKLALYADQGIYRLINRDYWTAGVNELLQHCAGNNHITGLVGLIHSLGKMLGQYFPPDPGISKNELPDDLVFGK